MLGTADLPGVSAIASAVAESAAQDRIPWSALEYSGQTITSISGSAIGGQVDTSQFYPMTGNPSSFVQSGDLSAYAKESSVSGKLDASASSLFAPSGDYAFNSSVSGKLDATASSLFAPSGDYALNSSLSSYLLASASSLFMPSGDYQTAGDYAYNSAVSSKLDASASSEFYLTSNPSGFITGVDLSNYATTGYVDSSLSGKQDTITFGYDASDNISSINGSSIGGQGGGTKYSAGNMISLSSDVVAFSSNAGLTDIQFVTALPANPVATVLYLIPVV